jgi:hypothetical protein
MDLSHGGAELAPLRRRQPNVGADAGVQHRVQRQREAVQRDVGHAGAGHQRRRDVGHPMAVEVMGDRSSPRGVRASTDLEEVGRALRHLDAIGPRVGVVADRQQDQLGGLDPEARVQRPDDRVVSQIGWLTHQPDPITSCSAPDQARSNRAPPGYDATRR